MVRRSKSYDALVREDPDSIYLRAMQPKQNQTSSVSSTCRVLPNLEIP